MHCIAERPLEWANTQVQHISSMNALHQRISICCLTYSIFVGRPFETKSHEGTHVPYRPHGDMSIYAYIEVVKSRFSHRGSGEEQEGEEGRDKTGDNKKVEPSAHVFLYSPHQKGAKERKKAFQVILFYFEPLDTANNCINMRMQMQVK